MWDGLLKLVSMIAVGLVMMVFFPFDQDPTAIWVVSTMVLWILLYRQGLSTISSWLYATLSLRTPVSLGEASELRTLFQVDLAWKWVPLREIKKLPKAERRPALFAALEAQRPTRLRMFF